MSLAILQNLRRQQQAKALLKSKREEARKRQTIPTKSTLGEEKKEKKSDHDEQNLAAARERSSTTWREVPILFLYGTETGNAKEICGLLVQEAKDAGHESTSYLSMRDYMTENGFEALKDEKIVVIVVSTTGQGDPPKNAEDFWRQMRRRKEIGWLKGLSFSILGLGDTNYADFCAMGKFFDSSFARLGAHRFYSTGYADDATGIDEVVEPWRKGLIPALKTVSEQTLSNEGSQGRSVADKRNVATNAQIGTAVEKEETTWFCLEDDRSSKILILVGEEDELAEPHALNLKQGIMSTFSSSSNKCNKDVQVMSMKQYCKMDRNLEKIPEFALLILIMSTSGPGEAPTNAMRFMTRMKKAKAAQGDKWLQNVRCVTLGIGSTNYDNFCGAPKQLVRYLKNVGSRVHATLTLTCVDKEDKDYIKKIQSWQGDLLKALLPREENKDRNVTDSSVSNQHRRGKRGKIIEEDTNKSDSTARGVGRTTTSKTNIRGLPKCNIKLRLAVLDADDLNNIHVSRNKGLVSRLQSHLVKKEQERQGLSPDAPFNARVKRAKLLTTNIDGNNHHRHVLHLEMALPGASSSSFSSTTTHDSRSSSSSSSSGGGSNMLYLPGDSVGIHCPNEMQQVDRLLKRLNLTGNEVITDIIRNDEDMKRPTPISSSSSVLRQRRGGRDLSHIFLPISVRDMFLYCLDITSPPKKSVLRVLASHCTDSRDKDYLLSLCKMTPIGREGYAKHIVKARPPLSEILERFSSCKIPLDHLVQVIPPLLPRYYSIASSPSTHPTDIHVAFSLVRYDVDDPFSTPLSSLSSTKNDVAAQVKEKLSSQRRRRRRSGLCTNFLYKECSMRGIVENDYLKKLGVRSNGEGDRDDDSEVNHNDKSSSRRTKELEPPPLILPIFIRRGGDFGYPSEIGRPIVMVGPGTGVAPFRGFLHYRSYQIKALISGKALGVGEWRGMDFQHLDDEDSETDEDERIAYPAAAAASENSSSDNTNQRELDGIIGEAMLFFGCQKKNRDFLYGKELEAFESDSTLDKLHVAFSREKEDKKTYVQHLMLELAAQEIYRMLVQKEGYLFVCGDGTRMAKDVMNTVIKIVEQEGKLTHAEAKSYVVEMLKKKRYVQDIWS